MTVIIGIDAEWQTSAEGDQNQVISCQWFGLDGEREWSGVHYPEDGKRLTISDWPSLGLNYYKSINRIFSVTKHYLDCATKDSLTRLHNRC